MYSTRLLAVLSALTLLLTACPSAKPEPSQPSDPIVTSETMQQAVNNMLEAVRTGDFSSMEGLADAMVPDFVVSFFEDAAEGTISFDIDDCFSYEVIDDIDSATYTATLDCQEVIEGVTLRASGQLVTSYVYYMSETLGQGTVSATVSTPAQLQLSLSQGDESFSLSLQGEGDGMLNIQGTEEEMAADGSGSLNFTVGMAATSSNTGSYSYTLTGNMNATGSGAMGYVDFMSVYTAQGEVNGSFTLTDILNDQTMDFKLVTTEPFMVDSTKCEYDAYAGALELRLPDDTLTVRYSDCGESSISTSNVLMNAALGLRNR